MESQTEEEEDFLPLFSIKHLITLLLHSSTWNSRPLPCRTPFPPCSQKNNKTRDTTWVGREVQDIPTVCTCVSDPLTMSTRLGVRRVGVTGSEVGRVRTTRGWARGRGGPEWTGGRPPVGPGGEVRREEVDTTRAPPRETLRPTH